MTDDRVKVAMDALKAAPVCITRMTGDGGGYEVCRWVDRRLIVMEAAPTAGSADVLKDEIDRRAKAEAVIAALDAHDGAPIGWRPIDTAVCDNRLALVEWKDGHLTVEDLDHDSDPTYWKRRGARQWCDVSELVNRGISPHTKRSAADAARGPSEAEKRLAEIAEIVAVVRYGDWSQWSIARGLQRISDLATLQLDTSQATPSDPATAPDHTDLMVPPETIDAFMRDNPLPPEVVPFTAGKDAVLRWILDRAIAGGSDDAVLEATALKRAAFPSGREGSEE